MNAEKKIKYAALLLITAIFIFLTLNKNSKSGIFNHRSEIYADKAGYYVYLPAFFIYNFQGNLFPIDIDLKTGDGFKLDSNKVYTKYTYGVAFMQAPFFLVNHSICSFFNLDSSGFSSSYHKAIDIASVFYLIIGLICLSIYLKRFVSIKSVYITLLSFTLGTNLFYYAIDETGMSHIYSFSLFSIFMLLSIQLFDKVHSYRYYLLLGSVMGLIIAVRPMNVIFFPVLFIVQTSSLSESIKQVLKTPILYSLFLIISMVVFLVPQLLYWKYSSGSFFHYAYTDEGFSNLLSPELIKLWFSTNNGLFTFSPVFILSLIGLYLIRKERPWFSLLSLSYFIGISYLFSSWWSWHYGCSFGSRPFIEYYTFFAIPFAYLIEKCWNNKVLQTSTFFFILICIIINLKLSYSFDDCWYGGLWDWKEYFRLLAS